MLNVVTSFAEAFHEGGWPMYPILTLGILHLVAAVRYAGQPDARELQLVRSLGAVTLSLGVLGTILGVIHSLGGIGEVPLELVHKIALLGLGESLNDLALALLMIFFGGLLTAVGALRQTNRAPAEHS